MTYNRTTKLQSLSKLKKAGRLRYWHGTIEIPETELHAICDEIQAEHDQAIAATLGNERLSSLEEKTKLQGDYIYKLLKERYELTDEGVKLRDATHGTLTAEKVREAIEEAKAELLESCEYVGDMYQRQSDVLKAFGKMEQAIAATLGNELNQDGLPVGLTISDDGALLNWRGENYVRQGTERS